jgi:hypothetical protein
VSRSILHIQSMASASPHLTENATVPPCTVSRTFDYVSSSVFRAFLDAGERGGCFSDRCLLLIHTYAQINTIFGDLPVIFLNRYMQNLIQNPKQSINSLDCVVTQQRNADQNVVHVHLALCVCPSRCTHGCGSMRYETEVMGN